MYWFAGYNVQQIGMLGIAGTSFCCARLRQEMTISLNKYCEYIILRNSFLLNKTSCLNKNGFHFILLL